MKLITILTGMCVVLLTMTLYKSYCTLHVVEELLKATQAQDMFNIEEMQGDCENGIG